MERRGVYAAIMAVLVLVSAATLSGVVLARHGRGHHHPVSAEWVAVNGTVAGLIDYRSFTLEAGGSTYTVVLPEYMTAPNGSKVPASAITSVLPAGTPVAVEGYAHERPCYGDVVVKAYVLVVGGSTYTWASGP